MSKNMGEYDKEKIQKNAVKILRSQFFCLYLQLKFISI